MHYPILWPDHNIGKRESRRIRNEQNALYNDYRRALEIVQAVYVAGQAGRRISKANWIKACGLIATQTKES